MTDENQTPADRLGVVESLLNSTHVALRKLKALQAKDRFVQGEIYAYGMVLDVFAEMGFDIGDGEE